MTFLQKTNCFAIGLPLVILSFEVFEPGMFFLAFISTIVTGFLQVSIGLSLLVNHYKNRHLQAYFLFCILFFLLWHTTDWGWIWAMPLALAIYMTIILHFIIIEKE
ncbi:hypothetical protein ABH942_002305 [Flavobacterium sp. 28YEA47A]|uniref:hypothetical protein n=1 Tax=Flavobacterium sp. 28YEA47A TaxID=3156276 RepID=UPI003512CE26